MDEEQLSAIEEDERLAEANEAELELGRFFAERDLAIEIEGREFGADDNRG